MALNGSELFSLSDAAAFDYSEYRLVAIGSASGRNTLTFAARHGLSYVALDAVFVVASVPERAAVAAREAGLPESAALRRHGLRTEAA